MARAFRPRARDNRWMLESGNHLMTGLMALGMAWLFLRADAHSATSRALALALVLAGIAIFVRVVVLYLDAQPTLPVWSGLLVLPGSGGFLAAFEWTLRVRQTLPAGQLRTDFGDRAIRVAQALVVVYSLAAIGFPDLWIRDFQSGHDGPAHWGPAVLCLFVVPLSVAMAAWAASMFLCLNRRPEPAERVRLIAVLFACPLASAGLVLPIEVAPLVTTLGFFVLLAGAMRHAQLHGRRGQFMSRFLSPQVADLVNRRGLRAAMQENSQTVSVVCCDLRGFTAFAAATGSARVLQLLNEYYDIVGEAVVDVEGTIKDYAGDGILILIGAPIAQPDHALRAVRLATSIRERSNALLARWRTAQHPLGLGIGVASGAVTVGIIGGEGRLEYAAVGPAVNLASRLCDQAVAGDILLDGATVALLEPDAAAPAIEQQPPLHLKGFTEPVSHFALHAPVVAA